MCLSIFEHILSCRNETVIEIIGEIREATEEEKEEYERQLETEIDWREVLLSKFLKNH